MTCEELLRQLADYADGALAPELCAELERHLGGCSPCAELRQDLADLARLCRCDEPPRLPEAVRQRIAARLRG
jgi:RNA polymerase sigma-70 factor (ECF subfamily)